MNDCIFCKIVHHQIPSNVVLETDAMLVIKDRAPQAPIHLLILPKYHVIDIQSLCAADQACGSQIFSIAQQLSRTIPGGEHFRLVINNGYKAGQRVFHLHAHFLAGQGDGEL